MLLKPTRTEQKMLAEFLDAQFKMRLMEDRNYSLRDWAREIGVSVSTLSRWMNKKSDPDLSAKNLNTLVSYFGQPVLDSLGIKPTPARPRNPMHGK